MALPRYLFQNPCRKSSAFSLIEVTLAVGVVSFALLVAMATIPAGLSALSEAGQSNTRAEIIRAVSAELRSTPFDRINDYLASSRFPILTDVDGVEVPESEAVFTIRCKAEPVEGDLEVRRVRIFIGTNRDPDPEESPQPLGVQEYPITIADWGL